MWERVAAVALGLLMFGVPGFILALGEVIELKKYNETKAAIEEERRRFQEKIEKLERGEYEDKE